MCEHISFPVLVLSQSCPTFCDPVDCSSPGSSVHGDSPGNNTGVGCHSLLQGTFQTQGLNLGSHMTGRFFTIWATRETQLNSRGSGIWYHIFQLWRCPQIQPPDCGLPCRYLGTWQPWTRQTLAPCLPISLPLWEQKLKRSLCCGSAHHLSAPGEVPASPKAQAVLIKALDQTSYRGGGGDTTRNSSEKRNQMLCYTATYWEIKERPLISNPLTHSLESR